MGGGLIQLATKGAQDVYLTGDPSVTFFKIAYKKHTNFARENVPIIADKKFAQGSKAIFTISRNADMIGAMYLHFVLNSKTTPDNNDRKYATYINFIDILIGGNLIDRQYGTFLDIWHDLTIPSDKMGGMIHNRRKDDTATLTPSPGTLELMGNNFIGTHNDSSTNPTVVIPLNFWFNKNTGVSLPLISLIYHQVTIEVNFSPTTTSLMDDSTDQYLLVDYFYLDSAERDIFANQNHEYLIEQVQYEEHDESANTTSTIYADFSFNHPIKEILWTCKNKDDESIKKFNSAHFSLNGTKLTTNHPSVNFSHLEPIKFHTRIPPHGDVFLHSFSLRPEEYQPSGTCNFSRIDTAQLIIKPSSNNAIRRVYIYATNYNILKLQSGFGALAFSS